MELKRFFDEIDPEKRLGLGCMRLPLNDDGSVDYDTSAKMVDLFMDAGFNYFDTAKVYHNGESEKMIKKCVADRYPRESFVLTDKLSDGRFKTEEDIRPLVDEQLRTCGVEYFDFYLMHALRREIYPKYQKTHAFEIAKELKDEGKIKHIGISFHDDAEFLEEILNDHPEIEIVQIQFNYMDFDDPAIQSRELYELCEKYEKPILIMEPVRGGSLASLPEDAKAVLDELLEEETEAPSAASYALRFVASFPQVAMVLSGMGSEDMIKDNVETFTDFDPLEEDELNALTRIKSILKSKDAIPCTACHYCTSGCPKNIKIPELFTDYNSKKLYNTWNSNFYYSIHTKDVKASDCIECGQCEKECPQKLPVRELLKKVAAEFE